MYPSMKEGSILEEEIMAVQTEPIYMERIYWRSILRFLRWGLVYLGGYFVFRSWPYSAMEVV